MSLTDMERSSIRVSHKSQSPTYHLLPLGIEILEQVVAAAQDGQGDWKRVQQVPVWVVVAIPLPRLLFQPFRQARSARLKLTHNLRHSIA